MSNSIDITVQIVAERCIACGVIFGVEASYQQRRKDDHKDYSCPNGHWQHYLGKTEADKLREQLRDTENRLKFVRDQRDGADRRADHAERRLAATKGVVTKMKKRASAGICPCCTRHFENLERHMATKHPDFAGDEV